MRFYRERRGGARVHGITGLCLGGEPCIMGGVKVVAIANQKGGVGKTSTAVNLSAALAQRGKKVLLIDVDSQANASSALGIFAESEQSLYQCLIGEKTLQELIIPAKRRNLSIVPSHMDLSGVEVELTRSGNHSACMRDALEPLRRSNRFEYVILDTPPSLGVLMTASLCAADEVLTPLQCEFLSMEGLSRILYVIEQIRESGINPNLRHEGVLMTMYNNTNLANQVVAQVRQNLPDKLYTTVIPRAVRVAEAPSFGRTVLEHDPHGLAAQAYRDVAGEFLRRHK